MIIKALEKEWTTGNDAANYVNKMNEIKNYMFEVILKIIIINNNNNFNDFNTTKIF